jgi:hypothetical protein
MWSQITKVFQNSLDHLAQLEIDLARPEILRFRSRPIGEMSQTMFDEWDYIIKDKSSNKLSYKDLVERMMDIRLPRDPDTELKVLDDSPWPLSVRSIHHWSSKTLKNAKRDAPKHALVALAEVVVVAEYRPKLLEVSEAARYLRTRILSLLNQGVKKAQGGARGKWEYPDNIKCRDEAPVEFDSHQKLLLKHSCIVDEKNGREEVSALMKTILKHRLAMMKPGDQAYLNLVAPEVVDGARELLNVSGGVMDEHVADLISCSS